MKILILINLECEPGIEVVVANSQNFITHNDSMEEKEVVRIIYLNHFRNTEKPNVCGKAILQHVKIKFRSFLNKSQPYSLALELYHFLLNIFRQKFWHHQEFVL